MYRLKQPHLAWHNKLCRVLGDLRFKELPSAPYVFRRTRNESSTSCVLVYADDLLLSDATPAKSDAIVEELKILCEICMSDEVELFLRVQLRWRLD